MTKAIDFFQVRIFFLKLTCSSQFHVCLQVFCSEPLQARQRSPSMRLAMVSDDKARCEFPRSQVSLVQSCTRRVPPKMYAETWHKSQKFCLKRIVFAKMVVFPLWIANLCGIWGERTRKLCCICLFVNMLMCGVEGAIEVQPMATELDEPLPMCLSVYPFKHVIPISSLRRMCPSQLMRRPDANTRNIFPYFIVVYFSKSLLIIWSDSYTSIASTDFNWLQLHFIHFLFSTFSTWTTHLVNIHSTGWAQVGALRKVVVFRTLAQEQLENLADALEAEWGEHPRRWRRTETSQGDHRDITGTQKG